MAKHRLIKMLPAGLLALVGLAVRGALASSPRAADSMPSPSADVDLICHTNNPAECYPKIFQATHEFQVVHHDQDLPPGLHVRLNVYTGKKEAKINVPNEDNPALEGVPVDSSVLIVERDSVDADKQVPIPPQAPAYDPVGRIKTPQSANADEGSAFYRSLAVLKKGLDVDAALEMLEDISHDIYYGLKIAEDYDTVRELFCLAGSFSSPSASGGSPHGRSLLRARLAALTLAATVQNNPKALAEISHHWAKLSSERCSPSSTDQPLLGELTFRPIHPHHHNPSSSSPTKSSATPCGGEPSLLKARITLLSGLLRSPTIRRVFLTSDGPSHLLQVLTLTTTTTTSSSSSSSTTSSAAASANADPQPVDAWEPARRAAAFLLLDNFLDGDMGAALGELPRRAQASDGECAASFAAAAAASSSSSPIPSSAVAADDKQRGGGAGLEECWDWHVQRLAERYKGDKGHWSHELRERLVEQRRLDLAASTKRGKKSGKEEL